MEFRARYTAGNPGPRSGYVDLPGQVRLNLVTPVDKDGRPVDLSAATANSVRAASDGLELKLDAPAELNGVRRTWYGIGISGVEPLDAAGRANPFQEPRGRMWRLVYKADQTSVLVAADTLQELDGYTRRLLDGGMTCPRCAAVPRALGMNPYLAVTVNGR